MSYLTRPILRVGFSPKISLSLISSQRITITSSRSARFVNGKQKEQWYSTSVDRKPLFDKILIANRGEIACRVMQTAKKLGIRTVAVFSEADANALHVKMADEAYLIGPPPSASSYLSIEKILQVAKVTGAQAIHPGYGFLSENPTFSQACTEAGITFIGPPPEAMLSMGSKSESKIIMTNAGVPCVPGYHGENNDPAILKAEAEKIGYPVLIKAIKGGGGKGMRIVERPEDFEQALESSKRESLKSFGDDQVLIEKYLSRPRHIEVQIFSSQKLHDQHVYLFERDCSVQRRHQKVLEEAPAPGISEQLRRDLGEKAVAAARAVGYEGAGTVEFIFDARPTEEGGGNFYFMEMNTRLQVEHPVTEMVCGVDLVEWQLEVAAGNPLPKSQDQLKLNGHAFEARIYAENPNNNFLPSTGPLLRVRTPQPSSNLRVETGFLEGDVISVYYDPMIAKLVVAGNDRPDALRKMARALGEYQVVGVETNLEFLKRAVDAAPFKAGGVETGFIQQNEKELLIPPPAPSAETLALAAYALLARNHNLTASKNSTDPFTLMSSFRLNHGALHRITLTFQEHPYIVEVSVPGDLIKVLDGKSQGVLGEFNASSIVSEIEGSVAESIKVTGILDEKKVNVDIACVKEGEVVIFAKDGTRTTLHIPEPAYLSTTAGAAAGSVKTPMPCKISQVLVKPGQVVEAGTPLIVLEAMKMEHLIKSPHAGKIKTILYQVGDLVGEGKSLLNFFEEENNA